MHRERALITTVGDVSELWDFFWPCQLSTNNGAPFWKKEAGKFVGFACRTDKSCRMRLSVFNRAAHRPPLGFSLFLTFPVSLHYLRLDPLVR